MAGLNQQCQILNDLQCEICKTNPRVGKYRWYTCLLQHKICEDCNAENESKICERCEAPLSVSHCNLTEKLLKAENMRFMCKNTRQGCKAILEEKPMLEHEKYCRYRFIKCPCPAGCNSKVLYYDLQSHFVTKHGFRSEEQLNRVYVTDGKVPTLFVYDEQMFIFTGIDDFKQSGLLYFWIQIIGSNCLAEKYYFTIEFHGTDPNVRNSYTAQAFSIDEDPEDIKNSNKCLAMKAYSFKTQFLDEEGKCKVLVNIRNLKEEVKDGTIKNNTMNSRISED